MQKSISIPVGIWAYTGQTIIPLRDETAYIGLQPLQYFASRISLFPASLLHPFHTHPSPWIFSTIPILQRCTSASCPTLPLLLLQLWINNWDLHGIFILFTPYYRIHFIHLTYCPNTMTLKLHSSLALYIL
jgi:hypothetical protein